MRIRGNDIFHPDGREYQSNISNTLKYVTPNNVLAVGYLGNIHLSLAKIFLRNRRICERYFSKMEFRDLR